MFFKKFFASPATPDSNRPDDKIKTAPAGGQPAAQPTHKQNEKAPAQKS